MWSYSAYRPAMLALLVTKKRNDSVAKNGGLVCGIFCIRARELGKRDISSEALGLLELFCAISKKWI